MIQAIETHYKGYRFRSRLEARWAVFFDALGWDWQYEIQGYIAGVPYLPDFLLLMPRSPVWVEIKPNLGLLSKADLHVLSDKMADLTYATVEGDSGIGYSSFLLFGVPGDSVAPGLFFTRPMVQQTREFADQVNMTVHMTFGECPLCKQACLVLLQGADGPSTVYCFCTKNRVTLKDRFVQAYIKSPLMMKCYDAARSARFEHGETPRVQRGKPRNSS